MTETKKVVNETKNSDVNPSKQEDIKPIEISGLFDALWKGYGPDNTDQTKANANQSIKKYLKQIVAGISCNSNYNILILYDSGRMVKSDADDIYNAVATFKDNVKPLLLVLYSNGGSIGSAYLIGKLCREYSNGKFIVTVPRQAKSAAALLCCAADEIHMGSLSELGPVDPQINQLPALGLKNAVEHIANLVQATPESADMFAKYLHLSLKPIDLGYYERVAESAEQYAVKLLEAHKNTLRGKSPQKIANTLVRAYKDHGFVIDKGEAQSVFGEDAVKTDLEEYSLGNAVYKALSLIEDFLNALEFNFYFIGSLDSDPNIRKKASRGA